MIIRTLPAGRVCFRKYMLSFITGNMFQPVVLPAENWKGSELLKKLIGVTTSTSYNASTVFSVNRDYPEALIRAGAVPVMLPVSENEEVLREYSKRLDGLLIIGGCDIAPELYGQKNRSCIEPDPVRDRAECFLARAFVGTDKPVLGICRGAQLLNCAFGGTMIQDIGEEIPGSLQHARNDRPGEAVHRVRIVKDSLLYQILGKEEIGVNSRHHQAADRIGEGFLVCAEAEDGVTESIWMPEKGFVLGVQWHPETMAAVHAEMQCIFDRFVCACAG